MKITLAIEIALLPAGLFGDLIISRLPIPTNLGKAATSISTLRHTSLRPDDDGRWIVDYTDLTPEPPPFTTIAWRLIHVLLLRSSSALASR